MNLSLRDRKLKLEQWGPERMPFSDQIPRKKQISVKRCATCFAKFLLKTDIGIYLNIDMKYI